MLSIQEASIEIDNELKKQLDQLYEELDRIGEELTLTAAEFKSAAEQGDTSENAAYNDAKDKMTKLSMQKLYTLGSIDTITAIESEKKYVPRTYIGLYSTFRMKNTKTGEILTLKVFPGSFSELDKGILSSDSEIYSKLQNKEVGDKVVAVHRINGNTKEFIITEVY